VNFARILHNKTYATVHAEPMIDRHGADVLSVVAKLALAFDKTPQLGLSVRPIRLHDEADGFGAIRYPCDLAVEKVGTDIALVGTLVPPEQPAQNQAQAWLRVGTIGKAIQVFGPRVFMSALQGVTPGPSAPLGRTPLIAALAHGGTDQEANPWSFEPHNPVGRGHAASPGKLVGRPAPQIEPAALLDVYPPADVRSSAARAQAAFAPIPPQWEPRRSRAGTEDAHWRRTRAPVVPEDFDPRSESWAPVGLWSETPLTGAEAVELGGLRPGPPFRFLLPGFAPSFHSVERGALRHHETHLDGVLFDLDDGVIELVWRAAIPLPLKWARLERIDVLPHRPLAPEIVNRPQHRGSPS
jgi:hypothetical protein